MIELIKGQTVSIDNHDRANGQPIFFDDRIHIHKRMNKDRYTGFEVYLYLNADKDMKIENHHGKKSDVARLNSEMKKAFKDPRKRTDFVESMLYELNRKCTYDSTEKRLKANLLSAQNIAKQFELRETSFLKNDSNCFEVILKDNEGNSYFLLHDVSGKTIRIGDSQDIVENWNKLFTK